MAVLVYGLAVAVSPVLHLAFEVAEPVAEDVQAASVEGGDAPSDEPASPTSHSPGDPDCVICQSLRNPAHAGTSAAAAQWVAVRPGLLPSPDFPPAAGLAPAQSARSPPRV